MSYEVQQSFTDTETVPARTVKLGIHNTYDKRPRTTPIDFQGQGSRSHATHCC